MVWGRASRMKGGRVMVMVLHEWMSGQISCSKYVFSICPGVPPLLTPFSITQGDLPSSWEEIKLLGFLSIQKLIPAWYLISLASWIYLTNWHGSNNKHLHYSSRLTPKPISELDDIIDILLFDDVKYWQSFLEHVINYRKLCFNAAYCRHWWWRKFSWA